MKARFEEEITKDVVDYMIYGTIMLCGWMHRKK